MRSTEGLPIEIQDVIRANSDCYTLAIGMICARCDRAIECIVLFAIEDNLFLDARSDRVSLYLVTRGRFLCTPAIDSTSKMCVTILLNCEYIAVIVPRTDKVAVMQAKWWGTGLQDVWGNAGH